MLKTGVVVCHNEFVSSSCEFLWKKKIMRSDVAPVNYGDADPKKRKIVEVLPEQEVTKKRSLKLK